MTEVKICIGTSCHLKGSYNILMSFMNLIEKENLHDQIALASAFCMNNCQNGVCVTVDGQLYSVRPEEADSFFHEHIAPKQ